MEDRRVRPGAARGDWVICFKGLNVDQAFQSHGLSGTAS